LPAGGRGDVRMQERRGDEGDLGLSCLRDRLRLGDRTEADPSPGARGDPTCDVERVRRGHRDLDGLEATLHPGDGRAEGCFGIVRPDDAYYSARKGLFQDYHGWA